MEECILYTLLMVLIIIFLFGIIFGSFLNVLIDRLSTGRNFVKGRSYCENCKKTLTTIDLIPLFSYLFLKGKCRHCKKSIPIRLFLVELAIGFLSVAVFVYSVNFMPNLFAGIAVFFILYSFLGIFVADYVYGIIPDLLVMLSIVATIFYLLATSLPIGNHLFAGIGSLVFFLSLFAVTRGRGMGFGDVKLSFVLGLLLGFPLIVVSLYIAFLTGAIISIILVICKKLRFFGGTIPFGPFLIASTIVSLFYGNQILVSFLTRFF